LESTRIWGLRRRSLTVEEVAVDAVDAVVQEVVMVGL
jgi:hypothetical protein